MAAPSRSVPHVPYDPGVDAETASARFHEVLRQRRSVREFADRPVSRRVIESIIAAAGTAPSGANKQPWRFVAVQDPALKREIRLAAEEEERAFYAERANPTWLADLAPLGTDPTKPFLERAPWLIIMFKLVRDDRAGRPSDQVYYVNESVGIAAGFLIAAIHHAGLVTLTHTPSPMKFLERILRRPAYERAFLLLPVGYPAEPCSVPDIRRKPMDELLVYDRPEAPPSDA